MKQISELRRDIVSGDWVVIATGRAKRPHDFLEQKKIPFRQSKKTCPFEVLEKDALLCYSLNSGSSPRQSGLPQRKGGTKNEQWWIEAVPNKFPAFTKGICAVFNRIGPYEWTEGVGAHEVVVTHDHGRPLALMTDKEAELVIRAYQERYHVLSQDDCVQYISIFHNHGRSAGASIAHPHSQIIAIPVVPPDIARSLAGSKRYFHAHKKCVHCVIIAHEAKERARIIYQNEHFVALAPYASRSAFEIRIFPKTHSAHVERMKDDERILFAHTLRISLAKLYHGLNNPDYNFFIHTAPIKDGTRWAHYHWHLEIVPKTAVWAGFEIGTGIEISAISPESAAEFLREIKVEK